MARSKLRRQMARARKRRNKMAEKKKEKEQIPDIVTLPLVREIRTRKGINRQTGEMVDVKTTYRDDAGSFFVVIDNVPYGKEKNRKLRRTGVNLGDKLYDVLERQETEDEEGEHVDEIKLTRDEFVELCDRVIDDPPEGIGGESIRMNRSIIYLEDIRRDFESGDGEEKAGCGDEGGDVGGEGKDEVDPE
ncbi:MAG TPA: hypothetical protein VMY18_01580 [Acidobacteriota bacterium]|nr:hypothetical protein [Acidobacteriota bacterium]